MSPASQIGANQILDESLTSADIKNGTVAEVDLTAAVQLKLNAGNMLKSVYDTNNDGRIDPAALGTGTPTASTYLNGVGAWASISVFARLDIDNVFTGSNTQKTLTLVNQTTNYASTFTQADGPLPAEWLRGTSFYATNSTMISVMVNAAKLVGVGADALAYLNIGTFGNGTIKADLSQGSALVMRYGLDGSGYQLTLQAASGLAGQLFFERLSPGVANFTLFSRAAAVVSGTFSVVMTGGTFDIYEGATLLGSPTDGTYASGFVGIAAQAAASNSLDNFSFTYSVPPSNPPAGQSLLYAEAGILKLRDSTGAVTAYGAGGATATVGNPAYANISAAYAIKTTDYYLFASAATAAFSATLPTAVGVGGKEYTMKKTDSTGNAVSFATSLGQTIDGSLTAAINIPNMALTVVSDNANWQVI